VAVTRVLCKVISPIINFLLQLEDQNKALNNFLAELASGASRD